MNEMHATLDRLERRVEDQGARIDALYRLLEVRGILPRDVDAGRADALPREEQRRTRRRAAHFHIGTATGV